MKNLFILLLTCACLQGKAQDSVNVILTWNGGSGSLIDSVKIAGHMYGTASVIRLPAHKTSDIIVYITYDNNASGDTDLMVTMASGFTSDKIVFRKTDRRKGSRLTKGTFKNVNTDNLKSIILKDH